MTSSTPETSTRITGAHRAHREARDRAAARTVAQRSPARYEPYLDGLFTYCMSVLCDHDAATAVLGDVLVLAERRGPRVPETPADRRPWLYALARWACLRRLAEARRKRQSTHAAGRAGGDRDTGDSAAAPPVSDEVQEQRRRELSQLAWPEAAGTTPEQREALELAVRHHLAAHEVAAVLGMDPAAARDLLASAACEVERTRAALAVVETGACPAVARLTGDNQLVLGTALRRELVRHVDDCPRCRHTAERAVPGRWPGAAVTPAELPVLTAPRAALHRALAHPPRARGAALPRFDRRGFPMDPKDRAARRDRIRARAVTTTVVATVVAAPVLALWAAYRATPAGEDADGRSASASETHDPGSLDGEAAGGGYENTGNATPRRDDRFGEGDDPDVSVEVLGVGGASGQGAARLAVTAGTQGDITLITLRATGRAPVRWAVSTGAHWLYLSRSSGTLAPGESLTVRVYIDPLREPSGFWRARVMISPAGSVVTIKGRGTAPSPSGPGPRPGGSSGPGTPGDPPPSPSDPTPTTPDPSDPGTPSDPPPTSPEPTSPEPTSPDPTSADPSAPGQSAPGRPGSSDPAPPPGRDGGPSASGP
ncbi:hypothetical protein SZN_32186 [Streptomyces zinciresistens K42]|uniref:Uncharacterized protein n=1 Tax=Streptomyces zinciresistens K42 TaxID=700597 RepID=G2GLN5_9ACTN|nr:sigma-70 family RNA polymerase sigma factor [Streptomyces zinciresistens]EGX55585.1 hypothetical protein SZN_32186 [Streptomyces zinciresistens K42]